MKSLGYQVLKGRGISFIDDKMVKIKGSEVGFSLLKLEKIFAIKQQLNTSQTEGKIEQKIPLPQQQPIRHKPINDLQKIKAKELDIVQNQSLLIDLEKQLSDLIYGVMKAEQTPDHLAPEWLKKLRQKKRITRHL